MPPQTVPVYRKKRLDGMLFVRTKSILETMVKAPLIVIGLLLVSLPLLSQASARTLDLTLYADGSVHISTQLQVDPLQPDFEVELFGPSVDNFVAVGEDGFLLSSEVINNTAKIDTFGSSIINIDYDIHDLISKEGRIWTFSFDSPADYSLLMPSNSIIVGMNAFPTNMDIKDDQTRLELDPGVSEINYIFGATNAAPNEPGLPLVGFLLLAVGGAIVATVLVLKKRRPVTTPKPVASPDPILETMRDDDKEIVKFISDNGGQVMESDLRKKFLQPRTTMWRAVKRLERQGVIEIVKKDMQNLVKLKEGPKE